MLTVYPDYYPRFQCLAGRCRHTCCAGWEIDIDADTRDRYRSVPGELGARLAAAIDDEEESARFRLTEQERCPFLNEHDLCDLILAAGNDELLCRICRDHPRFRSFLPGRTEVGVGLCCEAAAALVLSQTAPVRLLTEGREPPEDAEASALLTLRGSLFAAAQDRSRPLEARMEHILALCGAAFPPYTMADWADFYQHLERLDETWSERLDMLRDRGDSVDIIHFRRYMNGREHEY
ncbi:MAG: flagellin lysine-N-methylase [Oscillospiraceae bacterium]